MAKKGVLNSLLGGLGLHGNYSLLIDRAIRNDWDATEFIQALIKTKAFKQSFPGLITNGRINDFIANGRDSISSGNLSSAISNYKRLQEGYQDVAEVQGLTGYKITPQRMKAILKAELSPDEFGERARIQNAVNTNPQLAEWYNRVRKEAGLKPVDKVGLFKDILNKSSQFYDLHEAAKLGLSGLGYTPKDALALAKGIGQSGTYANVDELVGAVREHLHDIGPELDRQGIGLTKLTSWMANPGVDPDDIASKVKTLIANRRATGQRQVGSFARQGSGGGIAIREEQGSRSY